jgi:hypothetical protein
MWHDNAHGDASTGAGEGQRLTVISARCGDDAGAHKRNDALKLRESKQAITPTPQYAWPLLTTA